MGSLNSLTPGWRQSELERATCILRSVRVARPATFIRRSRCALRAAAQQELAGIGAALHSIEVDVFGAEGAPGWCACARGGGPCARRAASFDPLDCWLRPSASGAAARMSSTGPSATSAAARRAILAVFRRPGFLVAWAGLLPPPWHAMPPTPPAAAPAPIAHTTPRQVPPRGRRPPRRARPTLRAARSNHELHGPQHAAGR